MGKYVGKNALTAFWNGIKAMFSDVAFSGDYDDLDSKPSVETAASGGTTESLVTTGEKYDWNEKAEVVELTQAEYDALSEAQKTADIVYMITDSPDNYLDDVFGDFASVEYTSTASKAYAVGDYLVYDGKFYKVTSAIAQGGTITVGTNVTRTTVGDEIDALEDDKYEKPSGGIPASDLSSDVQTSLGKADTALQYQRLYANVQYSTSIKNTIALALSALDSNLPSNRTYPIIIVMTGSYAGTYTGIMAVTDSAIRFFIAYESRIYSGLYVRSSRTVSGMAQISTTDV